MRARIGVMGMGAVCAAGHGIDALVRAAVDLRGRSVTTPPYDAEGLAVSRVAMAPDIDRCRPAWSLLRSAVDEAIAGRALPPRTGLVVGTSSGDICGPWERWHEARVAGRTPGPEPSRRGPTDDLAKALRIGGPVLTLSAACISGTAALLPAVGWLEEGICDAVIVAGIDALSGFIHAGFSGLGVLSPGDARPFHPDRQGLVPGEGAGALLLMRDPSPDEPVAAWVAGIGAANDARHVTAPDRNGCGAAASMSAALRDASLAPDDVELVSLHGTGTVFNDAMEGHSVRSVFGNRPVPVHGIKGALGHAMGAAGALEALVVLAAIQRGLRLPPPREIDPRIPLIPPPCNPPAPRVALSTSSAFGGMNAAVCLSAEAPDVGTTHACEEVGRVSVSVPAGPFDWSPAWSDAFDRAARANRYVKLGIWAVSRLQEEFGPLPERAGVVLASRTGCRATDLQYHERILHDGAAHASRIDFAHTVPTAPAAEAAIRHGLKGPTYAMLDGPEAAAEEAERLVRAGRCDDMIALYCECPKSDGAGEARAIWFRRPLEST